MSALVPGGAQYILVPFFLLCSLVCPALFITFSPSAFEIRYFQFLPELSLNLQLSTLVTPVLFTGVFQISIPSCADLHTCVSSCFPNISAQNLNVTDCRIDLIPNLTPLGPTLVIASLILSDSWPGTLEASFNPTSSVFHNI